MLRSMIPSSRHVGEPFSSLQHEISRLFEDTFGGPFGQNGNGQRFLIPSIDVKETDKSVEVEAELPGVDEKDVQVTFDDGVLTIKGEKKTEKEETKAGYHVSERSYGSFLRTLDLPTDIDAEKISAKCVKGVLKITLPKLAEAKSKAKKIEIRGS